MPGALHDDDFLLVKTLKTWVRPHSGILAAPLRSSISDTKNARCCFPTSCDRFRRNSRFQRVRCLCSDQNRSIHSREEDARHRRGPADHPAETESRSSCRSCRSLEGGLASCVSCRIGAATGQGRFSGRNRTDRAQHHGGAPRPHAIRVGEASRERERVRGKKTLS